MNKVYDVYQQGWNDAVDVEDVEDDDGAADVDVVTTVTICVYSAHRCVMTPKGPKGSKQTYYIPLGTNYLLRSYAIIGTWTLGTACFWAFGRRGWMPR